MGSDSSAALGGHCIDIFINWLHPPSNKQTKQYANNTSREIVLVNTGASVSTPHIQSFSSQIPEMMHS